MFNDAYEYVKYVIVPAIKNSQLAYDLIDEIVGRCKYEYILKSDDGTCEVCILTALFITRAPKYQDNLEEAKSFGDDIAPEDFWDKIGFEHVYYLAGDDWEHISKLIVRLNDWEDLMAEEIAYEIEKLTENPELLSWNDHQYDR